MEIERIEAPGLAHYSYALFDRSAGEMIVVDPRRDIEVYLHRASKHHLTIRHVVETHIHADYCSGARELAETSGATAHASAYDEGETYTTRFPHRDTRDGETIDAGPIRLEALHTPGHTPEHLSFLVYDLERSREEPMALLSGDFLFVGSLGRPDLLGEAQKESLARQMFHSVRERLVGLPDGLEVFPAHGAGSMCGSGMSGRAESTLGFERATNPYLNSNLTEEQFVSRLLSDVPPFPPYYLRMKQVNAEGPRHLRGRAIPLLSVDQTTRAIGRGAIVVDLRDHLAFGGGHIPGSLGIGLGNALPVWAAWVVPYDTPIILVGGSTHDAQHAATLLSRVGLDDVAGALDGGIKAWCDAGRDLAELPQITPRDLARARAEDGELTVLDVRSDQEWQRGHIDAAIHIFGGVIEEHLQGLPRQGPLAVICGGGYRSTVVASVLQRRGFDRVLNVTGGMRGWEHAGLPMIAGI